MATYITNSEIARELGCSDETARRLMRKMPYFKNGLGRGHLRVRREDFDDYIRQHTVQPGKFVPRATPWETPRQRAEREVDEWKKQRRAARKQAAKA